MRSDKREAKTAEHGVGPAHGRRAEARRRLEEAFRARLRESDEAFTADIERMARQARV